MNADILNMCGFKDPGSLPAMMPSMGVSSLTDPGICASGAGVGAFSGGPLALSEPFICASPSFVAEQEKSTDGTQEVAFIAHERAFFAQGVL